jgi:hypothetical protein
MKGWLTDSSADVGSPWSETSDRLPFHYNSLGNKKEKDTAGCRVHHHKFIVTGVKNE